MHQIIMAGGSGTRLWPASRRNNPKQFLKLFDNESLFQKTLFRALRLAQTDKIIVVTAQDQVDIILEQSRVVLTKLPSPAEVLIFPEPCPKNTAPALALACLYLRSSGEANNPVLAQASDHIISEPALFEADTREAGKLAALGYLVSFGVPPRHAETGYGYIESGVALGGGFQVVTFHEKPEQNKATEYLNNSAFFWNSGIFCFTAELFLRELQKHKTAVYTGLESLSYTLESGAQGIRCLVVSTAMEAAYRQIPAISVDYAVMEKTRYKAMIKASFSWSDIGSWDELARIVQSSDNLVASSAAHNNFVLSDLPVALAGVKDLIVVVKHNTVLVCHKGESQLVKEIVEVLKDSRKSGLL